MAVRFVIQQIQIVLILVQCQEDGNGLTLDVHHVVSAAFTQCVYQVVRRLLAHKAFVSVGQLGGGSRSRRWGEPSNVVAAVRAHDEALRRLAAGTPGAILVDADRRMPRGATWYNDPCHFTSEGSKVFAGYLVEAMLPLLGPPT